MRGLCSLPALPRGPMERHSRLSGFRGTTEIVITSFLLREPMRVVWGVVGMGLMAASVYLWWYSAAERAANAPDGFVNLLHLFAVICTSGASLAWSLGVRKAS